MTGASVDFESVFRQYGPEIQKSARNAYVPGMDVDDIYSEMLICLWKASTTFDSVAGTKFPAYWWSLWLNRRKDLFRSHYAAGRGEAIPTDDIPDSEIVDHYFPTMNHETWEERTAWTMLGEGFTATEVQELIPRRRYYGIIRSWRTDAVRSALLD